MWLVWPRNWNSKYHLTWINSNLHSHTWPEATIFGRPSSRDFLGILFPSEKESWPLSISAISQAHPHQVLPNPGLWDQSAFIGRTSLLASGPCLLGLQSPSGLSTPGGFSWVTPASAGRGDRLGMWEIFHLEPRLRLPWATSARFPFLKLSLWTEQSGRLLTLEMTQKVSLQDQTLSPTSGLQKLKFKGTGSRDHVTLAFYPPSTLICPWRIKGRFHSADTQTDSPCVHVAALSSPNRGPRGRGGSDVLCTGVKSWIHWTPLPDPLFGPGAMRSSLVLCVVLKRSLLLWPQFLYL